MVPFAEQNSAHREGTYMPQNAPQAGTIDEEQLDTRLTELLRQMSTDYQSAEDQPV
jgi:hypothetical protein